MLFVVLCALLSITSASPADWRVVGGQDAEVGQFPYQISIRLGSSHSCGGTIINNRYIVTAAHCVKGIASTRLSIVVGTILLNDPNARVYAVESTITHDDYGSAGYTYDIALIRTKEDIEFNANVQPLPLNTEDIGAEATVILSGWGQTSYPGPLPDVLQWIHLKSISVEECRIKWFNQVGENEICTLTRKGEGACHGDSGGPLVYNGKLAGIVSGGWPCALGHPDVFTRVSRYISWIEERIF